jgi:hypothetical protein
MTTEADRRRQELDDLAARRRDQVRADFEMAMSARRTEAMRAIAEQRATARAEAEQLVADATAEAEQLVADATAEATAKVRAATDEAAERIQTAKDTATTLVSEAQREVDRLRDLRSRLTTQLTGAREILSGAEPLLIPVATENDLLNELPKPAAIPRQRERHVDDPVPNEQAAVPHD